METSINLPKLLKPAYSTEKTTKCEDDLQTFEETSDIKINPKVVQKELSTNKIEIPAKVCPIITLQERRNLSNLEVKFMPPPYHLWYLQIKSIDFKPEELSNQIMDVLVFQEGYPFTEIIRYDFTSNPPKVTTFNGEISKNVCVPFIRDAQNSRLICILYNKKDGLTPHMIGHERILASEIDQTLALNWYKFTPEQTIEDLFTTAPTSKLGLIFKVALLQDPEEGSQIIRTTSYSALLPSPILSIFNINISYTVTKKKFSSSYFIKFKIIKKNDQKKEKLSLGMKPTKNALKKSLKSSKVVPSARKLVFPDIFQFCLNGEDPESLSLYFKIYKVSTKKKPVVDSKEICLQMVICHYYTPQMIPNFERVNKFPKAAIDIYKRMKSEPFSKIILSNKYNNNAVVKASLYKQLSDSYISSGDDFSAFITEWKLCSVLLSQKLPYIEEEKFDVSKYKELPQLISPSLLYDDEFLANCLLKSLELCQKCGFFWIIHNCSRYIIDFFNGKKDYNALQSLCATVSGLYSQYSDVPKSKVLFKKYKLDKDEVIMMIKSENNEMFSKEENPNSGKPILVRADENELIHMNVKTFHYDFLTGNNDWNSSYVTRYIYVTNDTLPSICGHSKISKQTIKKFTKKEYFIEKFESFNEKLRIEIDNVRSLAPPQKLKDQYLKSGIGITAEPFLELVTKITNPKKEYYKLAGIIGKREEIDDEGIPEEVIQAAYNLWNNVIQAMNVADEIGKLNQATAISTRMEQIRNFMGVVKSFNFQQMSEY
ncbi:hypothetical protein GPJ56_001460 [Histomonas meleagridis]|uniref:uncharacterized protein n=1 Tax=Histomonas meleagridis TaxID=135588 RepID=UPI00355A4969|nr:hypothetical protein GPJ56_001460 [Histomonas meleagridis]KAH0798221.1 hypothetical protein GO595_009067 [Histomonas meleagridis]